MVQALVTGFGLGLLVAAAIGPISLLCMRTVLAGATASGVAIGAGAGARRAGVRRGARLAHGDGGLTAPRQRDRHPEAST